MDKSKIKATIIILVILVVCAVIAAFATGRTLSKKSGSNTAQTAASAQTSQTPEDTQQPQDSAQPTDTPEPSQTAQPESTPKPETSKAPTTSRKVSGSGSFASNTGTPLNLVVDWSAKALSDTEIQVTFEMYLNCYTINATPKPGGASITVNGQTYTASTPALQSSSATPTTVRLCTKTVTMSLAAGESLDVPGSASWAFGGKYSDVDLTTIDAAGTMSIQG